MPEPRGVVDTITIPEWDDLVARTMSEKTWQEHVRRLALACGWLYYHTHDSRHSPEGFPDLVLVRSPRVILAELKRETGTYTRQQFAWLEALAHCPGVEVYIWRPSDRDLVLETLR